MSAAKDACAAGETAQTFPGGSLPYNLPPMHAFIALALVAVNLFTFLLFWRDKKRAMAGGARIAESDLLGLALIGGSPGALVARQLLQHKTSKQPFSNQLHVIFGAQIGVLISLTFF